ncbi:MAG: FAD-dependent oxidoreductase [Betaproteobacteria bacterium]|nr:FAD-dependent oxidoreductase [Betaproteobacteria bacterium]
MTNSNRRNFIKSVSGVSLAAAMGMGISLRAGAAVKAKIVVVGGGYGGVIAAKYLKMAEPGLEVVLIEQNKRYVSCPLSNEVLAGLGNIEHLTFGYEGLARRGITVVHDTVEAIDPQARKVMISGGKSFDYDRVIVSPGVDFKWGAIKGYDEEASQTIPHAWKAGPQTTLLANQIKDMKDGGVVIITVPDNPFRCPPGPYERAALIAHYLKQNKPRSKIILLDAKDKFSKQGLFLQGWTQHYGDIISESSKEKYGSMIEWVPASKGGEIDAINAATRTAMSVVGKEFKADVLNVIPPQHAGKIAHTTGLVNPKGWCPVDFKTFESTMHKNVHVIGDACVGGAMPKSGYAANSQAKVAVAAIIASLRGVDPDEPAYLNACYSLITPEHGISVTAIYQVKDGQLVEVPNSGGVSPIDVSPAFRKIEVAHAKSWLKNITTEMFG